MKKKKNKSSQQSKQEFRQHKNEFYKKMRHIMLQLGDAEAYSLLNKESLISLYLVRLRPYKVIKHSNATVTRKTVDNINKLLTKLMQGNFVEIGKEKKQFSLYEFIVYVETLFLLYRNADEDTMENANRFKACFKVFDEDYKKMRVDAMEKIDQMLYYLSVMNSDILNPVIRFVKEEIPNNPSVISDAIYYNNYVLEEINPTTEKLEIDGHTRSLYPVYLFNHMGFAHAKISPERLGIKGILNKLPLKVYVQLHVLERIAERLGKHFAAFNYMYIVIAISSTEFVAADSKNSFLFPVEYKNVKLGYLKGDIIGDKFVIRTFLFLTNNGTPEGKKLQKLIGLEKEDKKYLGIDQLSTFVNSDIKDNEKLKELFNQSGCGDLFKLNKNILDDPGKKEVAIAKYLTQYIGL